MASRNDVRLNEMSSLFDLGQFPLAVCAGAVLECRDDAHRDAMVIEGECRRLSHRRVGSDVESPRMGRHRPRAEPAAGGCAAAGGLEAQRELSQSAGYEFSCGSAPVSAMGLCAGLGEHGCVDRDFVDDLPPAGQSGGPSGADRCGGTGDKLSCLDSGLSTLEGANED